jgi:hypothetical protein
MKNLKALFFVVALLALALAPVALASQAESVPIQSGNTAPVGQGVVQSPGNANQNSAPIQSNAVSAPSVNQVAIAPVSVEAQAGGSGGSAPVFGHATSVPVPSPQATVEPVVYSCSISPVYKKLAVDAKADFNVVCIKSQGGLSTLVPCPLQIDWASNAGTVTRNVVDPTRIEFTAGKQTINGGRITAGMVLEGRQVACQATVDIYTPAKLCVLQPASATLTAGEQKRFDVYCYAENNAVVIPPVSADSITQPASQAGVASLSQLVPCPELVWTSDAGAVAGDSTGATLTAANVGAGKFVEARYIAQSSIPEDGFYCRASVTVNAAPAPTPTPTPGGGGTSGGGMIYYPGGSGGSPVTPTPTAPPAPSPTPRPSPSPRPPMGKLVLQPVTPTPSPSPAQAAAPSGITGLFAAQLAPLAIGLFLGIIAVVLLWYWLAGSGKKKD